MSARAFIDTTVLVYAVDSDEAAKRATARRVLADDAAEIVLSTQVLSEYFVTVTRKLRNPLPVAVARSSVRALAILRVVAIDRGLVLAAIDTSQEHQLSYWDALIVESAASAGCERVLTEDLNAGATIHGVEIVNPFA